jgi:mannose-6-phosphate isomerase-like protein (cupin superfamily)
MPYTRRISPDDAVGTGYPDYQAVFLASPESTTVLAGFLGAGGHPPLHTHDVDLLFVVLEGSATVRLGHDSHQARAGVQLPATAPYVRSSSGPATETTGHETRWLLTDESAGVRTARVMAVERTGPEDTGTPASRDDDRLVVVTDGELTAEIAARPAAVPAQAVVVIPAGVPHRIWNSSPTLARYLDADVPAPDVYAKLALAQ